MMSIGIRRRQSAGNASISLLPATKAAAGYPHLDIQVDYLDLELHPICNKTGDGR